MRSIATWALLLVSLSHCRVDAENGSHDRAQPVAQQAAPLSKGDVASDFELLSQTGYAVSLYGLLGQSVAVYACPQGFDDACSDLATALRDHWLALRPHLSMAVILLPGGWNENRAISTELGLPVLLLSDRELAVSRRYAGSDAPGAAPRGYLVSSDHRVRAIYDEVRGESHVKTLLRDLRQAPAHE